MAFLQGVAIVGHGEAPARAITGAMLVPAQIEALLMDWRNTADLPDGRLPDELSRPYAKSSGIPQARSAARASIYATLAAKALVEAAGVQDKGSLAVLTVSNTATLAIACRFERMAHQDGWDMVDPYLLPNSIPSATATHVARATGAEAFSISLIDGARSWQYGLELAIDAVENGVAQVLLIAAEQLDDAGRRAIGPDMRAAEGAIALLIGSRSLGSRWELWPACLQPGRFQPAPDQSLQTVFTPVLDFLRDGADRLGAMAAVSVPVRCDPLGPEFPARRC